jgi:hypothetical protein
VGLDLLVSSLLLFGRGGRRCVGGSEARRGGFPILRAARSGETMRTPSSEEDDELYGCTRAGGQADSVSILSSSTRATALRRLNLR